MLCHAAQLSLPARSSRRLASIRDDAAAIVGLDGYGLAPEAPANLVVLDAVDGAEALRLQAPRRWVIHAGRVVAETETLRPAPSSRPRPNGAGAFIPFIQPQEQS